MRIEVRAKPNAKKSEILKVENDVYFIALKAAPEKGEANLELVKVLAKYFKKKARLVSGFTSKRKVVEIA